MGNCGLNIGYSLHNSAEVWKDNFRSENNSFGAHIREGAKIFLSKQGGLHTVACSHNAFCGNHFFFSDGVALRARGKSANIKTYFGALWWAAETVGLFSLSAALFAAWIISEVRSADTAVFGGGDAPAKKRGSRRRPQK